MIRREGWKQQKLVPQGKLTARVVELSVSSGFSGRPYLLKYTGKSLKRVPNVKCACMCK